MGVGIADGRGEVHEVKEGDTAIVVDALRASATVAALLHAGANEVTPVAEVPPDGVDGAVLVGEREGETLEEAALGNSPTEVKERASEVSGADVVLRTTNGTNCVKRVERAKRVYMGSLVNLSSLVDSVDRSVQDGDIWVVPAGRRGDVAQEDVYTANRIVSRLVGKGYGARGPETVTPESREASEVFREHDTGEFLRSVGQQEDIRLCSQVDVLNVAPVMREGAFVDISVGE
jgi:2-phosphosulfolactate phosphatase